MLYLISFIILLVLFVVYGFPLLIRLLTERNSVDIESNSLQQKYADGEPKVASKMALEPNPLLIVLFILIFFALIAVGFLLFGLAFIMGLYGGPVAIGFFALLLLSPYAFFSWRILKHLYCRWISA